MRYLYQSGELLTNANAGYNYARYAWRYLGDKGVLLLSWERKEDGYIDRFASIYSHHFLETDVSAFELHAIPIFIGTSRS